MLNIKERAVLGLWGIALLLIIPFNISKRVPPYTSFYEDSTVALLVLVVFFVLVFTDRVIIRIPRGTVYFIVLAAYWQLQPLVIDLPYPSQNTRISLFFVLMGLLFWGVQALLNYYQRDKVVKWVAFAMLVGALIQACVLLLQLTGLASAVDWIVYYQNNKNGQLGQRNLLGHYLMWGCLAAAYLTANKNISAMWGVFFIAMLSVALSLVDSRSIIAYVIAIGLLLLIVRFVSGRTQNKLSKVLFFTILGVLVAQWLVPVVLSIINIDMLSGLDRLIDNPSAKFRTPEWNKAWHSFLNSPLMGNGWHSYSYQSVIIDWNIIPDTQYHIDGIFVHSHNIILQILAEMGGIGAALVFGGVLWVIWPMYKKLNKYYCLWIFAILTVTSCHSLVEYPLWNSHFLSATVIFLALGQPRATNTKILGGVVRKLTLTLTVVSLLSVLSVQFLNQWFVSKRVSEQGVITDVGVLNYIRMSAMLDVGQTVPLLDVYGDLKKIYSIDIVSGNLSRSDIDLLERYNQFFSAYLFANLQGLSLYKQGRYVDSTVWMKKVWHYYPRSIPVSMRQIYAASPTFKELEGEVYKACLRQNELGLYPQYIKKCDPPPSDLTEKK